MRMLKFKVLLHRLFPKLYQLEETLEEVTMEQRRTGSHNFTVDGRYIVWVVEQEESDIVVKVKHIYSRNGVEIGSKEEVVTVPYMFAHAEPRLLRPNGETEIAVMSLRGTPVFQFRGQMYDLMKIGHPDYASMLIQKGKILDRAKNSTDIQLEYARWRSHLVKTSSDIIIDARC